MACVCARVSAVLCICLWILTSVRTYSGHYVAAAAVSRYVDCLLAQPAKLEECAILHENELMVINVVHRPVASSSACPWNPRFKHL